MEIVFTLDINDWVSFQEHYLKSSPQLKILRLIITWIVPVSLAILFVYYPMELPFFDVIRFVLYIIISILWVMIYPKRFAERINKLLKKQMEKGDNSGFFGLHTMSFTPEGIYDKGPQMEYKVIWAGIKKFEETGEYYFLYNTAASAIIIPKKKIGESAIQLSEVLKMNLKIVK